VQGRNAQEAAKLLNDSLALERAGCFSLVLEMVPSTVATLMTERLRIPTIGIGAGNGCDGQILVTDDLLGKYTDFQPRFVRRYANLAEVCQEAVANYASDVLSQNFPNTSESFPFSKEEEEELLELIGPASVTQGELTC
jgi:3-methyl-2-oxobutanoate hydroxymethyltransferase